MLPARAFIEVQVHGLKQTNRASIKRNPKQFRAGGSWRFTNVSNVFGYAICVGLTESAYVSDYGNFCCSAIGEAMEAAEMAALLGAHTRPPRLFRAR